ncbi:MAG: class I SAM-dependent methyltransferase [Fimbriimonadaceae bacterium]|nr:class I SAM-dependent methyltransferase [Fimbriimonadaceae bacterium]
MRRRFFAWAIDQVMRVYDPLVAGHKRRLFHDLQGTVLEIGPGTGPNMKHLPQGIDYLGLEPNPYMHPRLLAAAEEHGIQAKVVEGSAMEIPLPDASVDWVIGTLVLCSVPDQAQVLAEVRRVLKPGGSYRFIEHVAAPPGTPTAWLQRFIKPLWSCCTCGCNPDRQTWVSLEEAGFRSLQMESVNLRFPIISPHLVGQATR